MLQYLEVSNVECESQLLQIKDKEFFLLPLTTDEGAQP